jgi:hypothetical protein
MPAIHSVSLVMCACHFSIVLPSSPVNRFQMLGIFSREMHQCLEFSLRSVTVFAYERLHHETCHTNAQTFHDTTQIALSTFDFVDLTSVGHVFLIVSIRYTRIEMTWRRNGIHGREIFLYTQCTNPTGRGSLR